MPEGDKIGDAYIEARVELDKKSLKQAQAEVAASAEKTERRLTDATKKAEADRVKIIEKSVRAQGDLARQKQTELSKAAAKQKQIEREITQSVKAESLKREREARELTKLRVAAEKELWAETKKITQTESKKVTQVVDREFTKARKKRGKDGGVLNIGESFENVLSVLPGQIEKLFRNPAIAGAAAALGVEIIGQVGAAFSAATSLGVLGGGIALAISKDPQLKEAGKNLGAQLLAGFQDSALRNLRPAIKKSFDFLEGSNFTERITHAFDGAFNALGKKLPGLTSDVAETIQGIADAVDDLVKSNPEIIDQIGDGFVQIGNAVESVFNTLKDNGPGIKLLLGDLLATVSGVIRGIGKAVDLAASARVTLQGILTGKDARDELGKHGGESGLSKEILQYQELIKKQTEYRRNKLGQSDEEIARAPEIIAYNQKLNDAVALQTTIYNDSRTAALEAAGGNGSFGQSAKDAEAAVKAQNKAIADNINLQKQLSDAVYDSQVTELEWRDALAEVHKRFADKNTDLSINTEKGRENRRVIIDQVKAARDQAQAVLDSGGSAKEANKKFADLTGQIINNAGKNKAAAKAIRDTASDYKAFRDLPNVTKDITIKASGLTPLEARLAALTAPEQKIIDVISRETGTSKGRVLSGIEKAKAGGGMITGPGTSTSDSIPARLSNGEFVIKASSVRSIGASNLAAMNQTGQVPVGRARGGPIGFAKGGAVRSKTGAQVREYNLLVKQMKDLQATIKVQTTALNKWNDTYKAAASQFQSVVNLGSLSTEGKSAGDLLADIKAKKQKTGKFQSDLASLAKLGLSKTALAQISEAGPESDLAGILAKGLGKADVAGLNATLNGAGYYGNAITSIVAGKKPSSATLAKNKARLAKKQKRAAKLKAPKATGATIKYSGGKTYALLSSKEIANQAFKQGQYVTVIIDGKEVRAIVKQEQSKAAAKTNRKINSGKR